MKRIYKLIFSNRHFYREVSLDGGGKVNGATMTQFKVTMAPEKAEAYEITIATDGTQCTLSAEDGLLFQYQYYRLDKKVTFRCGDTVSIFKKDGKRQFLQCEMILAATLSDRGEQPSFDFGFSVSGRQFVVGGGDNATVKIADTMLGEDSISFVYQSDRLFIGSFQAKYGLLINGMQVKQPCEVLNCSFITIDGVQMYFKDGYLFVDRPDRVTIPTGWDTIESLPGKSRLIYPKFNRSTRVLTVLEDAPIEVLAPPSLPSKPKNNLLLSLLPSIAMLILVVVLRGVMSSSTGSYVLMSACMMGVGIVTSVLSFVSEKREYQKALQERTGAYTNYINRKRKEVAVAQKLERARLEETYHDLTRDAASVRDFTADLFDRRSDDPDFLEVYLGKGARLAARPISYKKREQIEVGDALSEMPEALQEEFKYIAEAPITVNLANSNAIGFVGESTKLYVQMKNLTLDLCTRQYYRDVKLFYIINEDFVDSILWLRWLPHVKNDDLGCRNIVCNDESKTELLEYLYILMTRREQSKSRMPHIVVFVLNNTGIKTHPISRYFEHSHELGVTFVFFESHSELLPEYCDEVVTLDRTEGGTLIHRENGTDQTKFIYSTVSDSYAAQIALRLAPVYCEEVSLENTLTKSLTFYEMLGIRRAGDLDLAKNWASADVRHSLAAPIGVNAKKEIVSLDIHEKAHGPHGLVAGTTGSGKSELLQTYILSMALSYHPYEVGFVIIDFKGGGTANQFEYEVETQLENGEKERKKVRLPHLVGTITNIDGDEINRSLLSIKAELDKRQRLFAEYSVNQIDDYIQKFKDGETKTALPHLIIIVDEFAELKANQPEFMKELISAARIGRSLGVHLILATQKPSGQVNEQIWSNSRFKLCLKVQSQSDSNEVIKSPLAAEIREPGRAYLQVGNNELFELLQSGYSGGPIQSGQGLTSRFEIAEVSLWGKHDVVYRSRSNRETFGAATQLQAVVEKIDSFCRSSAIRPLDSICLPQLPEKLSFVSEKLKQANNNIIANIGYYDDPENQVQDRISLDLTAENTMILGSAQYGKTNVIQTIVRSLAEQYSPEDVNIYILDFNTTMLRHFEQLPHVGGVVCANEDEKFKNLFKLLTAQMSRRKEVLVAAGTSSFAAYRDAGYRDLPQIVLCIDNYTAMKELYLQDTDVLLPIIREGIGVGISVVITNGQMAQISYRYSSNIGSKIALFCNKPDEYSELMGYCRIRPKAIPGNALLMKERRILKGQIYCAFEGEKEVQRVRQMHQFVDGVRACYPNQRAERIPVIPKDLTDRMLAEMYPRQKAGTVVVGLDYASVQSVCLDLKNVGAIGLSGGHTQGRTNFMRYIANRTAHCGVPATLYIVDSIAKPLAAFKDLPCVAEYSLSPESIVSMVRSIEGHLAEKYDAYVRDEAMAEDLSILLVSNAMDALSALSGDSKAMAAYQNILGKYRELGVTIVYNDFANESGSVSGAAKLLRDNRKFVFFDDLSALRFANVPLSVKSANKKKTEEYDAYYISGEEYRRIKTARLTGKP